jgi:hypothetical protein
MPLDYIKKAGEATSLEAPHPVRHVHNAQHLHTSLSQEQYRECRVLRSGSPNLSKFFCVLASNLFPYSHLLLNSLQLTHLISLGNLRSLSLNPGCAQCDRTTSGRGSSIKISLNDSQQNENIINTHKYTIPYIEVQVQIITN